MELNSKSDLPVGSAPVHSDGDFAKTIAESKEKIHGSEIKPLKRGRGRPRKHLAPDPLKKSDPERPSSVEKVETVDVSEFLRVPIIAVSKIPAMKYSIPELAFSEDEAKACAESLNQCLQAFVPNVAEMSPKTAAVIGACCSIGAIGFTKYQIYSEVTHKRALERGEKHDAEIIAAPQTVEPSPAAGNYFSRQSV